MPTLNNLIRNRATVTIETDDPNDPLIVTYQPQAITPRMEALVTSLRGRDDVTRREQTEMMDEYLSAVVHAWNLTNADGTPLAVTPETITGLDYEAKTLLFAAIGEDAYPGEANGSGASEQSVSPSKPQAQPVTKPRRSRTGTH